MALSDLQTALDSLDARIAALAATADSESSSIDGGAKKKTDLNKLLEAREKLQNMIGKLGGATGVKPVEVVSRWVP